MSGHTGRIVIVGAGIAGLCTAVYARRCGYEVEVVEQHATAGGLATSWRRGDFTFETCLHWLLGSNPRSKMHERWREVFDIDALTFVEHGELGRLETEKGESLTISTDLDQLEADLLEAAPQDAKEIRAFVSDVRSLGNLEMPDPSDYWHRYWWTLLTSVLQLPVLHRWSSISCGDYSRKFHHPLLRGFFGGGEPQISAMALVFSLAWMARRNAGYPIGGSRAVIGGIVERLQELGGTLRLGTRSKRSWCGTTPLSGCVWPTARPSRRSGHFGR